MIVVSLALNIAVLAVVVSSFAGSARWLGDAYGPRTPARDILVAIYVAILLASAFLLVALALTGAGPGIDDRVASATVALLGLQVLYKVGTAATVRRAFANPVVLSNLGIALVHGATISTLTPALLTA